MKNLLKRMHYAIYILLTLVLCVGGCKNSNKQKEETEIFITKKGVVCGVNTSNFNNGDVLTITSSGSLIKATAKDTLIIGMVIGNDSIELFEARGN